MDNYIKKILYLGPNGSNSQVACKLMAEKLGFKNDLARAYAEKLCKHFS